MVSLSQSLYNLFFSAFVSSPEYHVKKGNFDIVLIKPVNELFFIISKTFNQSEIPNFIINIVILIIILLKLNILNIIIATAISFFIAIIGCLIIASFSLIICSFSFKYTEVMMAIKLVTSFSEVVKYPITIFPRIIQGIVTIIIPFSFISYYPAKALMYDQKYLYILSIIVCCITLIISISVWKHNIKKYSSTGT
ncbi:ABC-2 type transport system permease protein [Clostridium frigidicarnis]|uniref:ABC-2 type transport system permease protein n=2 Tax=Clostridium frigidicarnis TaxID=84698 RepID=A0A1I0Y9J0_9CLOT|nr:ABC-2 type transport system permease protein [Clostridium frigidicarnis]